MKTECVAMLLAGGQGSRLGSLTYNNAKPAVSFGGKYRIIDFPLSNCMNSEIDVVGILTQYRPYILNNYISAGSAWALDRQSGGVRILPPYMGQKGGRWYAGTADAILQNIDFIDRFDPKYVLVLSGDHIYKMDYSKMIDFHRKKEADLTIAVMDVLWEDAHQFGTVATDEDERIIEFQEKPPKPKSNKASMGVYTFSWPVLRKALLDDAEDESSSHDFGHNVIPLLHNAGNKIFAYPFSGYWRDVGTIKSYYQANMDLITPQSELDLNDPRFRVFSNNISRHPQYIGPDAKIHNSLICDGCMILGEVDHSIISHDVIIHPNTRLKNTIVHTGAVIEDGAVAENCIIGAHGILKSNEHYLINPSDPYAIHVINS